MRGKRPGLKPIEGGKGKRADVSLPPLPEHLPAGMVGEWRALIADLQARKLWDPVMVSAIEAYCTSLWVIAECRKAIAADGAFTKTKLGLPKVHPAAGMLSKHLEIVARLAGEFGFSAAARSRKSLQGPGGAVDDDDASDLGV